MGRMAASFAGADLIHGDCLNRADGVVANEFNVHAAVVGLGEDGESVDGFPCIDGAGVANDLAFA